MAKKNNIEILRKRSVKVYSKNNLLEDYRFYGDQYKRKYYPAKQEYEYQYFNPVQNFLYKQSLFGLTTYNKTELKELLPKEKAQIISLHQRTQKELNIWKHQIIIKASNKILNLFHNSQLALDIVNDIFIDSSLNNRFSFKELGIKKEDVVERLHALNILPSNFYEINKHANKT